jgi:hypothetical protein
MAMAIAIAGQASKIELTDGSVLEAEVTAIDNGNYTLTSPSLGQLRIPAAKIRKIEIASANTPPANAAPGSLNAAPGSLNDAYKAKMNSLSASMAANPDIMATVSSLANDPEFQEIAKDPEVVNEVQAGNIQALMSNKKFMSVINHPKIQEINDKLKDQEN